jgi:hypothetical protein
VLLPLQCMRALCDRHHMAVRGPLWHNCPKLRKAYKHKLQKDISKVLNQQRGLHTIKSH